MSSRIDYAAVLQEIAARVQPLMGQGQVAQYIPELARVEAGMGHDLPSGAWDRVMALITDHVAATDQTDLKESHR